MNKLSKTNTHFIAGHHGVGKTHLAKKLKAIHNGILHLDTGPIAQFIFIKDISNS